MIPDLGKYGDAVLSAYGVSFVLLALIILVSLRRSRKMRDELEQVEARMKDQRSQ